MTSQADEAFDDQDDFDLEAADSYDSDDDQDEDNHRQPRDHVVRRTIVLPEYKVLFMPTPKAACTTILWQLARLAGIPAETFDASGLPEISTALTIHDMAKWDREFRWSKLDDAERQAILADDSWFRFTVVRNPATRVWSAWQSKLLLREPRWLEQYGNESWFPRVPKSPEQIVEDFRRFAVALSDPDLEDVHWTLQQDLVKGLAFNHVGRTESLGETINALTAHLDSLETGAVLHPGRENRTPLGMPRTVYDEAAAKVVNDRYALDFDSFGYDRIVGSDGFDDAWAGRIAPLLPILSELIDRNARVGHLSDLARDRGKLRRQAMHRLRKVEERLENRAAKRAGGHTSPVLVNLEGRSDFTVRWAWDEGPLDSGFTAIVRVKNEARPLPYVLPPLLRALKRVVLVDNDSTDGTPELAVEIAKKCGAEHRLRVVSYPFEVSRCGADHLATPGASVHSLTYFYNWSFSQVRTSYALKWDGDMVLTDTGIKALQDLDWQLEASQRIVTMPRYPLYVMDQTHAFFDVGLANNEPWGWPNQPGFAHVKAMEWELPLWPEGSRTVSLPEWSCLELKWLDADEFAHWSTNDFSQSARTKRKEREWNVYQSLNSGIEPPAGVIPIVAPEGVDVVEYARRDWLLENRPTLAATAKELARARQLAKRSA